MRKGEGGRREGGRGVSNDMHDKMNETGNCFFIT